MRELRNGTKIIGIDHGYGNCKSASTVTKTGIYKYDTEPIFSGNVLEFEGKFYKFGEGHKEFIPDKSQDEDFYLFTLMAVAKELSKYKIQTANVYLAVGLPLTWIRIQKESFKSYLMQHKSVSYKFIKSFAFAIKTHIVCYCSVTVRLFFCQAMRAKADDVSNNGFTFSIKACIEFFACCSITEFIIGYDKVFSFSCDFGIERGKVCFRF